MKFIIAKAVLWRELALLQQNVLDKKNHIPALSHIRLQAMGQDRLQLAGTDLDLTLLGETEALVEQAGVCVLPGRKLCDIVKNLPDAPVTITARANRRAEITCGPSHFKLAGLAPTDYPELPKCPETSTHLPAQIARQLIERTRFAITNEESRYMLAGAKFTLSEQGARMVATDGHRLALAENKAATSTSALDCLIPKKALSALAHLAAGDDGAIGLHCDANCLYAEIGARTLICRLLNGEFPAYEKILPTSFAHQATMSASELLEAVRRVAVMAQDRVRGVYLKFTPGELCLFIPEGAEGMAQDRLTVSYAGPPVTLTRASGVKCPPESHGELRRPASNAWAKRAVPQRLPNDARRRAAGAFPQHASSRRATATVGRNRRPLPHTHHALSGAASGNRRAGGRHRPARPTGRRRFG